MGGKDVIHLKWLQNSYLQPTEVQKMLKQVADRRFYEDVNESLVQNPEKLSGTQKKRKDPKHASPSAVTVYLEMRKREPGRKYKSNNDDKIKKMIGSGQDADADVMVTHDKDYAANWLVGRGGKRSRLKLNPAPTDHYVEEFTRKIKRDLESEWEAKVNMKVQENMSWMLKKFGEANPDLKFDIGDFCATVSSEDQDDNGTPVTQGGATQ